MPNYRRDYSGCTWFFTVVTKQRRRLFLDEHARACLREAVWICRAQYPFHIDAWVILPDHLHCVWTLPEGDRDYSRRWGIIKRRFTQLFGGQCRYALPFWQERFWAHRIDGDSDYRHHMDYVHINPVKHGLVNCVSAWPWSTFHQFVKSAYYPDDWGGNIDIPNGIGKE
ncbi:REP-associated tyrosine transposase [Sedimenticola selenatireducens]|uniref:Transposase n=1 Tax=Sedimenticola selenatireducens TaxID=191960 RepID=A0A558DV85_9GAMM|nr:transposase [Sedimenticola selenatireducens]TVO77644.1 transposase [Sedimenticola selenatireducens]TVT64950.1 MAG: transposase [Sedimenticola selenatireducens]